VAVADPHDNLERNGVWLPDEIGDGSPSNGAPLGAFYLFEHHGDGYRLRRHIGP
jgi:hypothetical protein